MVTLKVMLIKLHKIKINRINKIMILIIINLIPTIIIINLIIKQIRQIIIIISKIINRIINRTFNIQIVKIQLMLIIIIIIGRSTSLEEHYHILEGIQEYSYISIRLKYKYYHIFKYKALIVHSMNYIYMIIKFLCLKIIIHFHNSFLEPYYFYTILQFNRQCRSRKL